MDILNKAEKELGRLTRSGGIRTGQVRKTSAKLFKELDDKSINNFFDHCKTMLDEKQWVLNIIAYDWAYRVRKQYNNDTFSVFEKWLKTYVKDWSDCDDFCTHAFGYLLSTNNNLFSKVIPWVDHPAFPVRRAAAVVLIYPIHHNLYRNTNPLIISDKLMHDEHYLVLKG